MTVAEQGYGLDTLLNDKAWEVLRAIAVQGYGLDLLAQNEDYVVKHVVETYLKENGTSLNEWIKTNPDRCALPENKRATSTKATQVVEEVRSTPVR